MAAKKKRTTKRAPKRRTKPTAHRVTKARKPRAPKAPKRPRSTVRATSDADLSKLYASAVRAGEVSAVRRVRGEMKRRAELGELDSIRFHVPADVVREGRALLSPKRRR